MKYQWYIINQRFKYKGDRYALYNELETYS